MFKSFTPFIAKDPSAPVTVIRPQFEPCAPSQAFSIGYIPFPDGAPMHHGIERLMLERKVVPGEIVKRRANVVADSIERETGRRPKGKALKAIKSDVALELLAQAFPRRKVVPFAFLGDGLVLVGSTSASEVDLVLSFLAATNPGLVLDFLPEADLVTGKMREWVLSDIWHDPSLSVGDACVVCTESDGTATFKGISLEDGTIVTEPAARPGSVITSLALETDAAQFTLTDGLAVKGIKLTQDAGTEDDAAECFLWSRELAALFSVIREALNAA